MSGGEFDYAYAKLDVFKGELGDPALEGLLEDFQDLLRELEWARSGDSSEDDYRYKVVRFKEKWLLKTRR